MHSDCGVAGMLQCISVALKISTDIPEAERMHVSSLKSLEKRRNNTRGKKHHRYGLSIQTSPNQLDLERKKNVVT